MSFQNFKSTSLLLTLLGIAAFVSPAFAEDPSAKANDTKTQALPPGMDEAMMAKMKEYGTPNENHQLLQKLVGDWDYTMKWWMAPDGPADESTGTNEIKSILGGRFIEQNVSGTSNGQPFEGRGTMGFDNSKKEYNFVWIDNMGTGMMLSNAAYDPATKTFSEKGSFSCPLKGETSFRGKTKIIDDDTFTYEMYMNDKDGKEFKSMEVDYKRKK